MKRPSKIYHFLRISWGDEKGDEKGDVSPRHPYINFEHFQTIYGKMKGLRVENFDILNIFLLLQK